MKKISPVSFLFLLISVLSFGQNTHLTLGDTTGLRNGFSESWNYNSKNYKYSVQNRKEGYLGTLYQKASWANTNDFTANGATIVTSGSHLSASGGSGTFTATIDLASSAYGYTRLMYWTFVAKMVVTTQGNGVGLGIRSTNGWAANNWNVIGRVDLRNTGLQQMYINGGTSNTQLATSGTLASNVATNDTVYLTVDRAIDIITFTYYNKTQNVYKQITYQYDLSTGANPMANTGTFSIFEFGGTQEIDSIGITSKEIKNAQLAVVSDSKGIYMAGTGTAYNAFPYKMNNSVPVTIDYSQGSDRLIEVNAAFPELKLLAPKQVLISDLGRNDQASGRTQTQIKNDLQTLWDSCTAYGMQPMIALPPYETVQDMSWLVTWILATYPSNRIVDFWTPIKSNTASFLYSDNVHPTIAGHDTLYKTLLKSYIYQGGVNSSVGYIQNQTAQQTSASFNIDGSGTMATKLTVGSSTIGANTVVGDFQTGTDLHIKLSQSSLSQMRIGAYTDAGSNGVPLSIESKRTLFQLFASSSATEYGRLDSTGNWFFGAYNSSAVTGARADFTTSNAMVASFNGNASGAYIGFANNAGTSSAMAAWIGVGNLITSNGASDMAIRSGNNIAFGASGGTAMGSLKSGHLILAGVSSNSLTDSSTGLIQVRTDALGTTQTRTSGITLFNTTAAVNNGQQISPAINFNGKGYTGAASNDMWMREYMIPVQGSPVTGYITFEGAVAGGAYATNLLNIYNTGNVAIGTTTQNGLLTIAGVVAPEANATRDLGAASFAWRDVYFSHTISKTSIGVSSGLGTNVTSLTPAGSDEDFTLTIVSSANVGGTIGNIAFGRDWGATPHCTVSAANAASGALIFGGGGAYIALTATSSTNLTLTGDWTGAATVVVNCHCGL